MTGSKRVLVCFFLKLEENLISFRIKMKISKRKCFVVPFRHISLI